jgi:hypothetical protein
VCDANIEPLFCNYLTYTRFSNGTSRIKIVNYGYNTYTVACEVTFSEPSSPATSQGFYYADVDAADPLINNSINGEVMGLTFYEFCDSDADAYMPSMSHPLEIKGSFLLFETFAQAIPNRVKPVGDLDVLTIGSDTISLTNDPTIEGSKKVMKFDQSQT